MGVAFKYRFCLVDVMIPVGSSLVYRTVAIHGCFPEMATNCVLVQLSKAPHRRAGTSDADPPSPPTMAEVLMVIEEGRVRNENLLAQLVQQGARRNTECNNLNDFLRSQPPTFAFAKEPLDADDWLRALERKFAALHVPVAEQVNFATYCQRTVPGTGCVSLGKESSKGLNTESNNPQRASATVLADLAVG